MSEDQAFDLTMESQDGYRCLDGFADPGVPPLLLELFEDFCVVTVAVEPVAPLAAFGDAWATGVAAG